MGGYVTEIKRLSTFWVTAVLGNTHDVHFSSTAPSQLRLHLRDVSPDEAVLVRVHYAGLPNRVDVYQGGSRVAAAAAESEVNLAAPSATNIFDLETTTLLVVLKGDVPIDLIQAPVLQISVDVSITVADFFTVGYQGLVSNLAALLGIDHSLIKVPSPSSTVGRRRLTESGQGGLVVIINGNATETLPSSNSLSVSDQVERDTTMNEFASAMQGVQQNLTTAAESGSLSSIIQDT